MKILFTGASSFTGFWFVFELAQAGHDVIALFRSPLENYQGLRLERIQKLQGLCKTLFNAPFGSKTFLECVGNEKNIELFCHHAAEVANYKSPLFDPVAALVNNTCNLEEVLKVLQCPKVILTGSVFEPNEGNGKQNTPAVSPYGLSKGLTSEVFKYYCAVQHIKFGKFVIPNPFGPYEEERFTTYLVKCWFAKQKGVVNAPEYIRDNIPVTLLAKAYRFFAEQMGDRDYSDFHPSFYVEKQADFTARFAREMQKRLHLSCEFELRPQPYFIEPKIRVNHDLLNPNQFNWSEEKSWDQLAEYYAERHLGAWATQSV